MSSIISAVRANSIFLPDNDRSSEQRMRVTMTHDHKMLSLLISDQSTILFRGEEKTVEEILKYIQELEDALAEAHLTSHE